MTVYAFNNSIAQKFGKHALISKMTKLPHPVASIWLSLNEMRYSGSYVNKHLRQLNKFYSHCEMTTGDALYLDKIVLNGDMDEIMKSMRTFVAERQNMAAITGYDETLTLRLVTAVLRNVLNEIRFRTKSSKYDSSEIERSIAKLDSLYQFLKAPKSNKSLIRFRSLPQVALEEVFNVLRPNSNRNPFRTKRNKVRNFLIFALLYQMGLRGGEILSLASNCMNAELDSYTNEMCYWLDVRSSDHLYDVRSQKPNLKNEYSPRQIPLPKDLYLSLMNYTANYRGRCSHGFLFSSQRDLPLSERSLNDICDRVSDNISLVAKQELQRRCGLKKITPHNFRHSAAVDRIRSYRHANVEMGHAESLIRVFFGWSPSSKMPLLYAKAYYEEQLNTKWLEEFDRRITSMLSYEDSFL